MLLFSSMTSTPHMGGSLGNQSENQPYVSDFGYTLPRDCPWGDMKEYQIFLESGQNFGFYGGP